MPDTGTKIRRSGMLCILQLMCMVVAMSTTISQNLAPNPDFEYYQFCPTNFAVTSYISCTPWRSATWGTCDYFNVCANGGNVDVPVNFFGTQQPHSGDGYCGFYAKAFFNNDEWREYLQGPLTAPLQAGKTYEVSFYVNLADIMCGVQYIGAYFSEDPPTTNNPLPLFVTPQFETTGDFISDTVEWVLLKGCFEAEGGEAWVTIGNYRSYADTPFDPMCSSSWNASYYLIDDIYIGDIQPGGLDLELGGPVFECNSYTISPGITGVSYYWEDGSTGNSLTVTTTGTYSLTIYDNCEAGVDSIEVTINTPPVDINPDEITVCAGEIVSIALDPDAGDYSWSDGTDGPNIDITTTGVYTVTLDDGCDITIDNIDVTVVDPPAPFSLGDDFDLCTDDEVELELDPDLGDFVWQDGNMSNAYNVTQAGHYAVTITNICGEASAALDVTEIAPVNVQIGPSTEILCSGEFIDVVLDPDLGTYEWQDGSNDLMYHINTPGLYTVTLTHYCGPSSDTINVTTLDVPSFDLGDTLTPCAGDTIILSANNVTGDYSWQDGSDADTFLVTVSGTYTLTIENYCGTDTGDVLIMYQQLLFPPDLGPDFSLCPGETAVLSSGNNGPGITWQDQSTADTLVVNSAGTYYVSVSNNCFTYTDTVIVSIENTPPSVVLPDQLNLCQGSNVTLDPGLSGVTFNWSDGSDDPTLVISAPGEYSLTATSACGSDADTVIILDGGPAPFVSLGADTSVCTGEVINLNPAFLNVDTWLWMDGSMNPQFTTSSSGQVNVQVANACGTAYDTMQISLLPLTPILALGSDTSLCSGETFTLSISDPTVDIVWSDGSTGNTLVASSSDPFVAAAITNGCGQSADTVYISQLPDNPILQLGVDQSLCPGEVISFDPGIPGVSYLWQDGSTGSTFQTTQEVEVILTISNVCGTSTDTVMVTESTDGPHIDLGPDLKACEGVVITIPAGISGVNYLWQDGSSADEYVASASGWVYLTVSNLCGTDTDSVLVDISGVAPMVDLGNDTLLCEGVTKVLTSDVDALTTIQWQDGSSSQSYMVTSAGTYSLLESNDCGQAIDSIVIDYLPLPQPFTLGPDTTICPGESVVLTAPLTMDQLQWQDGSSQPFIIVDQAAVYSLQISNECGVIQDSIKVDVDTDVPLINLGQNVSWCNGDQIVLNAAQSFAATYLWSNGDVDPVITVSSPGMYAVEVFAPCASATSQVEVVASTDCDSTIEKIAMHIPNVFSPNGDGTNDVFALSFSSEINLTSIQGSVYDRWGNQVYADNSTSFSWDGHFRDEPVQPGVYAYVIKVNYTVGGIEKVRVFLGDVTVVR